MNHLKTMLLPFLLLLISGCESQRFDPDNICSIYKMNPDWEKEVVRAEQKWGIPQEVIMAVVRHESGFDGDVRAPRRHYLGFIPGERLSSAYGYAQALDMTWREYQEKTDSNDAERDDFADAVDFVGWYLNRTHRSLKIPREDAYNLYLAYHEGHRGFLSREYENHPRLMKVAKWVEETSNSYRSQLKKCRSRSSDSGKKKREKRFSLKINDGLPN
ncbi:MAG: transglycosylase SLT domain-containing protein [Gammaproteobacteria bacterium]|uniref:Transglycosylase SLT domain-containing protein n=1 Tax=Candidatus Thiopontia autotrophica TaxID=2841688 RepID=A0A8J6P4P2_9GAMM|nr:transglycosylase SLT domain-containing protein [Candidatus Thiopontia autotrophica]